MKSNMGTVAIIIIVIIIVLVGLVVIENVYFNHKVNKLTEELSTAHNNIKIVKDTLSKVKTKYGEIVSNYGFVKGLNSKLKDDKFYKDKEITSLQEFVAQLKLKIQNNKPVTITTTSDSLIGTTFHSTYKDSGLTVFIDDSVRFERKNNNTWIGYNFPSFDANISLRNTIGRNPDGTFYGSIESFSPFIKITKVKTTINDKYVPKTEIKHPTTFAIGGSLDNNSLAGGLRIRFGNYQVGAEYLLVSNQDLGSGIINHTRISLYWFWF